MTKEQYNAIALDQDILLFKWKSDSLKLPRNPEFWLTTVGILGYSPKLGKWVTGEWTKEVDEFGDFTELVYRTLATTPETGHLRNHDEVIVCGNTHTYRSSDPEREFFSMLKEETDNSIIVQLLNSRFAKALVAENDQKRKQILKAFDDIKKGKPVVITTPLFEELRTVDLTDPKEIEKMQYLSSFYQIVEKREANVKGLDLEVIDKKAQVNTEEINQYSDVTTLDYLVKYEERMRFVDEMKAAGYEIEIVPNPVFFDEPTKEDIEEGTFEAAEAEETPEYNPEETKEGSDDNDKD